MRSPVVLPLLLAGCVRDPTFFGYWDIVSIERDGVEQVDAGFFEVLGDASVALLLRYEWSGGAFVPDPRPQVQVGETDAVPQEFVGDFQSKDEVHHLFLEPFGVEFRVEDYRADTAVLSHDEALWPGDPASLPLPTTLRLAR